VLFDIEKIGMALEFINYLANKLRYKLFHIHFRLQAAIFDFSLTSTHGSVFINHVVLLDIEIYSRWNFVTISRTS